MNLRNFILTLFHSGYQLVNTGTSVNSEDTDEMSHKPAFHNISSGSALFTKLKEQFSGTSCIQIHHCIDIFTGIPLKYIVDNSILIVSLYMG